MSATPSRQFSDLQRRASDAVAKLLIEKPIFPLNVGWADNYGKLLSQHVDVQPESSVIDKLLQGGRVIISGHGGGGKTQLLRRMARRAIDIGALPLVIDLTEWTAADYEDWQEWSGAEGGGAAFLLSRFARPSVSPKELSWLPPSKRKLILVDGLNELAQPVGLQILESLDRFAQSQILTSVLITDRLVRRALILPERFALGLVMPLSRKIIERFAPKETLSRGGADLLDSPFFLNAARQDGSAKGKRSSIHEEFFRKHGGLTIEELNRNAIAAYQAYQVNGARAFDIEVFKHEAGRESVKKLLEAGIIIRKGALAFFSHHLKHDYLAARYVSSLESLDWSSKMLDTLSFKRSSFDAIALVFEQLPMPRAEAFLRVVYDWNLYAAGYTLGEGISSGLDLPKEMRVVILAMLAEKCFDNVVATSERAKDALSLISGSLASSFQSAQSLCDVFDAVQKVDSVEEWFLTWRNLFTLPGTYTATAGDLKSIEDSDSIVGWTMANVLRRVIVGPAMLDVLRSALANGTDVVRWRIAHVLGAFPSPENMQALLGLVDRDPDDDVRYGALRSMIEEAVLGPPSLRLAIEGAIIERIETLVKSDYHLDEVSRALVVASPPEGWGLSVLRIGRELFRRASTTQQMDRWRSYLAAASRRYGLLD
jgi:hypothetical protein